jgi:hypothetical protein
MAKLVGRWVAKLQALLLDMAALWFESRHLSTVQNGRHKQRNGRHTLARQKKIQKSVKMPSFWGFPEKVFILFSSKLKILF